MVLLADLILRLVSLGHISGLTWQGIRGQGCVALPNLVADEVMYYSTGLFVKAGEKNIGWSRVLIAAVTKVSPEDIYVPALLTMNLCRLKWQALLVARIQALRRNKWYHCNNER